MKAHAPITLEDLDRDELLHLVAEQLTFGLTEHDLRSARWHVLSGRAQAAHARQRHASDAYWSVHRPVDPSSMSHRAWSSLLAEREAKRLSKERADRAARRADAAEGRAWKALDAADRRPLKLARSIA